MKPDEDHGAGAGTLPALPRRLFDTVFSPGRMSEYVAANPKWVGALLVSAAILAVSTWLIPPELLAEAQRRALIERGVSAPEMTESSRAMLRMVTLIGAPVGFAVVSFVFAGLYTLVFAFILGDEGTYRQYLALAAHASIIPAVLSVLISPLRIATGDAQLTLNLGSFLVFLPDGYLSNVFRVMDLTQIWSSLVVAVGACSVDPRRGFRSAAAVLLGILVAFALVVGRFLPS